MTKMPYGEQLRHPNWQRRRLEIMESAGFACQSCGDTQTTLNVHHRLYVKGRMVWDYSDHELECLCESCHRIAHGNREFLDRLMSCGAGRVEAAIGLLGGALAATMDLDVGDEDEAKRIGGEWFLSGAMGAMLVYQWPNQRAANAIRKARDGTTLNPAEEILVRFLESFEGPGEG